MNCSEIIKTRGAIFRRGLTFSETTKSVMRSTKRTLFSFYDYISKATKSNNHLHEVEGT